MILSTQLIHLLLNLGMYLLMSEKDWLSVWGGGELMLSIIAIGQARASIQSPALYNLFVTVQDFTLFFLKCVYFWKCKKM